MKASPLLLLDSVSAESQNMWSVILSSWIGASSSVGGWRRQHAAMKGCLSNHEELKRSGSPAFVWARV